MNISLCYTPSENNVVGKSIQVIKSVEAVVKGDMSVESPTIIFNYDGDISRINYVIINEFSRKYFVRNTKVLTGHRYELDCSVDVLETYKNSIKTLKAVIRKTESDALSNMYFNDGSFVNSSKEFIYTLPFSDGFNENAEFILITAGGIASGGDA